MNCTDNLGAEKRLRCFVVLILNICFKLYVNFNVCWVSFSCGLLCDNFYEIIPTSTCERTQIGLDLHLQLHHQLHLDKEKMCEKSQLLTSARHDMKKVPN